MSILLLSGSRNLASKTKIVLQELEVLLQLEGFETSWIDVASVEMDFCDGRELRDYEKEMVQCAKMIEEAEVIVIGMPVYCYSVAGPLKNFIDITSKSFTGKKFAVVCQAGSRMSYLAAADLQKILGYESKALPLFPIVATEASNFSDGKLVDERAKEKMKELIEVIQCR